jgi:hypothetical protein
MRKIYLHKRFDSFGFQNLNCSSYKINRRVHQLSIKNNELDRRIVISAFIKMKKII